MMLILSLRVTRAAIDENVGIMTIRGFQYMNLDMLKQTDEISISLLWKPFGNIKSHS